MKYLDTYEKQKFNYGHGVFYKLLGYCVSKGAVDEVINTANKFNIKYEMYYNDGYMFIFPDVDKFGDYKDFLKNGWGHNFYQWYNEKYIKDVYSEFRVPVEYEDNLDEYENMIKYNL